MIFALGDVTDRKKRYQSKERPWFANGTPLTPSAILRVWIESFRRRANPNFYKCAVDVFRLSRTINEFLVLLTIVFHSFQPSFFVSLVRTPPVR